MAGDVHLGHFEVLLTAGTEVPSVHFPTGYGGMTILGADFINAGTSVGPLLVTMTNVGTPALIGTVGYFAATAAGTITGSATIPNSMTEVDAYVAEGEWLGFDQASGTVPTGSFITFSYLMGQP